MIQKTMGAQSLAFTEAPCIINSASVVGKKESEGPLGDLFDMAGEDDLFGEKTWEEAESRIQKEACVLALGKAHVGPDQVRYLYGGDLLRQGIATSMGAEELQIPMFGLFGACSTSGEALALASMSAAAGYGEYMLAVTSSHFGTAEKEFRFPLSYASQRPLSAQWTVTGSAAFLVSSRPGPVRIAGVTVGKIVDFGLKDSQNMGACMAPAAADTIACNLEDFGREAQEYDRIITGDLGYVGQSILLDLMRERGIDISGLHLDCGKLIFDQQTQDTHAGGSGCCPRSFPGSGGGSCLSPPGPSCPRSATTREPASRGSPTALCWNSARTGRRKIRMEYINAFWVGGAICALVQILLDRTKLMPGRVMVLLVCTGAVLGFLGIYQPFAEFAGGGASVPLLGFGNTLWNGVKEAVEEEGFIGIFLGGFKASAAGISAALIFGYLASLVFEPKMKK